MGVISERFVAENAPMICGSAEAEAREYQIAVDKNRNVVWFYTLNDPDPAGHVYVHNPRDVGSDGYGGRTITFKIGKTATYNAKGPWHSNSDALYEGTGVDLRDKHLTFVVIAKRRGKDSGNFRAVLEDVLYMDEKPTLGPFKRGEQIAKRMANELGHPVCCYSESGGGSCGSFEYPEGTSYADWKDRFNTW
jgi:hypothetical protein